MPVFKKKFGLGLFCFSSVQIIISDNRFKQRKKEHFEISLRKRKEKNEKKNNLKEKDGDETKAKKEKRLNEGKLGKERRNYSKEENEENK